MLGSISSLSWRQQAMQMLSFLLILSSALAIWKSLSLVTGSESPIVVVLRCAPRPERS